MAGILKVDRVQSDSNLAFQVGSSNVAYFNTTGMNLTGGEIIAGGSTLRTTSGLIYANNGIKFPATQSSSADANTLDDYEEGSWSPLITFGSTVQTVGTYQSGRYVKIGKFVHVSGIVSIGTKSGSGTASLTNLPFTSQSNTPTNWQGAALGLTSGVTFPAGTSLYYELNNGATNATLFYQGTSSSAVMTDAAFASYAYFEFSIIYIANA